MIRRLLLVPGIGVLAASGAYALIYLFRWEWHRAIITALFFVAAEVGLGISVVLRRLARLEQRVESLVDQRHGPPEVDPAVLARIREAAPEPPKPFAWLDPQSSNLSVFLPFLLGVGALASGLAWLVEQTARRTTTPLLERRLAERLVPIALPAGGLLGVAPPAVPTSPRRWSMVLPVAVTVAVLGLSVPGIDWLGDALQTRPDHRRGDVATRIEVELRGARSAARPVQVAATLWGTCTHVLHGNVAPATIAGTAVARVELLVPVEIGEHAEERLRGCLQDAVVDRVQATVVGWESVPAR